MRPAIRSVRMASGSRCGCGWRRSSPSPSRPGITSSRPSRKSASASRSCPPTAAPRTSTRCSRDRDFDIAINTPSYRPDPAISTTILYQGGLEPGIPFSNQGGYDNPELNQVIADGLTTVDTEARKEIYDKFQQIVADELPSISLVDFVFTPANSDRVQNIGNNPRWPVTSWADVWLAGE